MEQQLVNAVVLGSVLTLFSLGLSLAWGTLDVLNLAHGAVFVFAGYLAYETTQQTSLPFLAMLLIAMVGAGAVSVAMELVAFRRIRNRFTIKRQAELSMLVASIGASIILNEFISNQTDHRAFGLGDDVFSVESFALGPVRITNIQVIIVVVAILVAVAMELWIRRSRQGRAIRAVAYDSGTAELMGVNVNLVAAATMFVSGALAGLAGVLLALNISAESIATGEQYLITAFAILIVGGVGSIRGAVLAAYLIALAETAVVAYGPAQFRDGVAFLLILLVLLLRPRGLFSRGAFQRA